MQTTIARYRKLRGMTLRELASRVGKSYGRICEYEHGKNIPLATLWDIATVLNIPTGDLFENPNTGKETGSAPWPPYDSLC